ncbi:MBL fold metallo-hydrolase [Cloacibacillus evryensis]|uniref:MBL fold metallo-hydrolase n=2 Tax=Cloacibacillus evryensis TaxID=508460 RepID=UPI003AB7D5EF
MYDYGNGIYGVDGHYEIEGMAAVYVLLSEGRAAIIETAHNASLPYLLAALAELGVERETVDYICVTHVHLDHAGGAGSYMREFPRAKLVVHPRGARHMTDPAKLVEGVKAVYGDAETERIYGTIIPVPEDRVIAPEEGRELTFGRMTLVCRDAPGHAKHHMIFFEKSTRSLFAGDAFGISYLWMTGKKGRWAFPTASPVQFDPEAMIATTEMITALAPSRIFITHFGELTNIRENSELLIEGIKKYVGITEAAAGDKTKIKAGLAKLYAEAAKENNTKLPAATIEESLPVDLELNAQGLSFWYRQRHK